MKKYDTSLVATVCVFVFTVLFSICSVNILNFALSPQEPYTVEYTLIESVDKYEASHPTTVSTEVFSVKALNDGCDVEIKEIVVKQSLNLKASDTIAVEIRKGIFEPVYRVLGKVG